jgi:hypothetical protein
MHTMWNGLAIPSMANVVWTPDYTPYSFWLLLQEQAEVATRVQLPATTQGLWFWTAEAEIWYALGVDPGPIQDAVSGTTLPPSVFHPGGVLLPNAWQFFSLPLTSTPLTMHFRSRTQSPRLLVTALLEYTPS